MISSPSHVAVLVPSVRKAAEYLRQFHFEIGEEEIFGETKEIYVQMNDANPLLLMEPKGAGSYRRALEKRGPGIHHLAIDVLDLEKYLSSIAGSGWLLHLNSVKSIKDLRTAYLARPGFPALIEVQEKKKFIDGALFVENISLPFDSKFSNLVKSVGLEAIVQNTTGSPSLILRGRRIAIKELI